MHVSFKVSYHPSGRRTLTKCTQNEMVPTDCEGPLFANENEGQFYRAVAKKLHEHHIAGDVVDYVDANLV